MFKIIFGMILGIVLVTYYPNILTTTTTWFVDSGARDSIVKSLNEVDK
mgnify:FL=1